MISIQDLHRSYGRHQVLRGIELEVGDEIVAIHGANGSGKSTLLRLAAGITAPREGKIMVQGIDTKDGAKARQNIGYVGEVALYGDWSPLQHLTFQSRFRTGNALAALADAGVDAIHTPCARLSTGVRKRVALAMALLGNPAVLVLDEPFASLDAAGRRWLEGRLAQHVGPRLIVAHDQELGVPHRSLTLCKGVLQ